MVVEGLDSGNIFVQPVLDPFKSLLGYRLFNSFCWMMSLLRLHFVEIFLKGWWSSSTSSNCNFRHG